MTRLAVAISAIKEAEMEITEDRRKMQPKMHGRNDMYRSRRAMKEEISVIVFENGVPSHRSVRNELRALQDIVGGYIELVTLGNGALLICDEEGRLKRKSLQMVPGIGVFAGDVIICGEAGEDFANVPEEIANYYLGGMYEQ